MWLTRGFAFVAGHFSDDGAEAVLGHLDNTAASLGHGRVVDNDGAANNRCFLLDSGAAGGSASSISHIHLVGPRVKGDLATGDLGHVTGVDHDNLAGNAVLLESSNFALGRTTAVRRPLGHLPWVHVENTAADFLAAMSMHNDSAVGDATGLEDGNVSFAVTRGIGVVLFEGPRVATGTASKNLFTRLAHLAVLAVTILETSGHGDLKLGVGAVAGVGFAEGVLSGGAATVAEFTSWADAAGRAGVGTKVGLEVAVAAGCAFAVGSTFRTLFTAEGKVALRPEAPGVGDAMRTGSHPPHLRAAFMLDLVRSAAIIEVAMPHAVVVARVDPPVCQSKGNAGGAVGASVGAGLEVDT